MNARGEDHAHAKLTMWDVIAIRLLIEGLVPVARIARAFGVDRKTIRSIDRRLIWNWL